MPSVTLKDEAQEIALAEVRAVHEHVSDPEYAAQLAFLIGAIEQGEVPESAGDALGRVLELALQAGRIRAVYGPGGEQATLRLYRKLPIGAAVAASADEVSRALGSLAGKELESVSLRAVGPGSYSLSLTAGGAELSVRLDRQGARLASVVL
jgi:hypothetical protein